MTEQKGLWGWRSHTSDDFDLTIFPGGHFYLNNQGEAVLKNIETKFFSKDDHPRKQKIFFPQEYNAYF